LPKPAPQFVLIRDWFAADQFQDLSLPHSFLRSHIRRQMFEYASRCIFIRALEQQSQAENASRSPILFLYSPLSIYARRKNGFLAALDTRRSDGFCLSAAQRETEDALTNCSAPVARFHLPQRAPAGLPSQCRGTDSRDRGARRTSRWYRK